MRHQVVIVAAAAAGCSLFGDFTGYSSGSSPAAADGGPSSDAASEPGAEAGLSGEGSPDGGEGSPDAGSGSATTFVDLFDRPDGPIGNGWIEKTVGAFRIQGGELTVIGGTYQDLIAYRPTSEDVRDVEVSTEVVLPTASTSCSCDPIVFARLQHASIGTKGRFHGYAAYFDSGKYIVMARHDATADVEEVLRGADLSAPLGQGRYRLVFRVTGTSPVRLTAIGERQDGAEWRRIGEVGYEDGSAKRIQVAGSVGLGSDEEAPFRYDVFTRTAL